MPRKYLTPGVIVGHVVVLLAVATCLRLGWWQWEVSQRPGGTAQNLGYAVLWPVFAGSFIYMWLRFLQLETARDAADDLRQAADALRSSLRDSHAQWDGPDGEGLSTDEAAPARTPGDGAGPTDPVDPDAPRVPIDGSPPDSASVPEANRRQRRPLRTVGVGVINSDDGDDELAAYNRALAALAEQDDKGAH